MPGWPAAVTDTESPSQLIPSLIQRMLTSSTAGAFGSVATTAHPFPLQDKCVHEQLLATEQLEVEAPASAAGQRELQEVRLGAARAAAARRGHLFQFQFGAVERRAGGDELEGEGQRVGDDLAQVPDLDLHALDPRAVSVPARDRDDGLGDRELVHQQMRGSGSPTSWSITRRPPNAVSTSTMPGGSVRTSPISAARSHPGTARSAASAASAISGATKATSLPWLATYSGSMPRISAAPATTGATGTRP